MQRARMQDPFLVKRGPIVFKSLLLHKQI